MTPEEILSPPVTVEVVACAPRKAGTNAETKSPASKPAVVTAVTSLFFMM
jgi:hypothetical protein